MKPSKVFYSKPGQLLTGALYAINAQLCDISIMKILYSAGFPGFLLNKTSTMFRLRGTQHNLNCLYKGMKVHYVSMYNIWKTSMK